MINVTWFQSIESFFTGTRTVERVLIVGFFVLYYMGILRFLDVENLHQTFMFWLCAGLLIYFGSSALISAFGNLVFSEIDDQAWGAIWSAHGVLNILLYFAFIVAFWQRDQGFQEEQTHHLYLKLTRAAFMVEP